VAKTEADEIKKLRQLVKDLKANHRTSLAAALAQPPDEAGAAAEAGQGPKDEDAGQLAAKIVALEKQIKDTAELFDDAAEADACTASLRGKLEELKQRREAGRSPQASHARVQRQLGAACKQREALLEEEKGCKAAVANAFGELRACQARMVKQDEEIAALRESFRATAAAVESAGASQPRAPPALADPFELGLDEETLAAFPKLKELHEARDAWKQQVAEARAAQLQRLAAEAAARSEADVKMGDEGGSQRSQPSATPTAAPHGGKHKAGSAAEAADAACEPTEEMLDELVACVGDRKPEDDASLRGELAAMLRQHATKRAKVEGSG